MTNIELLNFEVESMTCGIGEMVYVLSCAVCAMAAMRDER